MNVLRIDHTGIAVKNLDEAIERYRQTYGIRPGKRTRVADQHVEVVFLDVGDTQIELICPTSSGTSLARFLEKRGEGLHHLAFQVQDIQRELDNLAQQGVELIDHEPRRGAHGLVAFVQPGETGGVLIELVERVGDEYLQA